jgi:hypothetical protein
MGDHIPMVAHFAYFYRSYDVLVGIPLTSGESL